MKVLINDIEYTVRKNYLHRGQVPRLVLEEKVAGSFVCIHFDNNGLTGKEVGKTFSAHWCCKNGTSPIHCKILE